MFSSDLLFTRPNQDEYSEALQRLNDFSVKDSCSVQGANDLPVFLGPIVLDFATVVRATCPPEILAESRANAQPIIGAVLPFGDGEFISLSAFPEGVQCMHTESPQSFIGSRAISARLHIPPDEYGVMAHDRVHPHLDSPAGTPASALRSVGIVQQLAYELTVAATNAPTYFQ